MEVTPTQLRKDVYSLLKNVNRDNSVVKVHSSKNPEEDAVVMSSKDFDRLMETVHIIENGQMDDVIESFKHENDDSYWKDQSNGIDWDKL